MNTTVKNNIESYINPNDLLEVEVNFELSIRNFPINEELLEKRKKLRKVQLEEILRPNNSIIKTFIGQEYRIIQSKTRDLKHLLETYPETRYISRLRHYRLRTLRAHAITREQLRLKEDLLSEIEILLERYGKPSDRRESLPASGPQLNFSQEFSKSFEEKMNQFSFNLSDMSTAKKKIPQNTVSKNIPQLNKRPPLQHSDKELHNLEEGLLDEAVGGRELNEEMNNLPPANIQSNLKLPFYPSEALLPRRKEQTEPDRNPRLNPWNQSHEESNSFRQQVNNPFQHNSREHYMFVPLGVAY